MTFLSGVFAALSAILIAATTFGSVLFARLDPLEQMEMGVLLTGVCAEQKFVIPAS